MDLSAPVLDLERIGKRFSDQTVALDGVDLTLRPGEFVSVVGPPGCGKTTLLRIAAGLSAPTGGVVAVRTRRLAFALRDLTQPRRVDAHRHGRGSHVDSRGYGFAVRVGPGDSGAPWTDPRGSGRAVRGDSSGFGGVVRSDSRDSGGAVWSDPSGFGEAVRADPYGHGGAIAVVGLGELAGHPPLPLSGAMVARAALAGSPVLGAELVLLDAPFRALDERDRWPLYGVVGQLFAELGFAALLATSSVSEAVLLSRRVIVLSARPGRVLKTFEVPFDYPRPPRLLASSGFTQLAGAVGACLHAASRSGTVVAARESRLRLLRPPKRR
jgi:NitT/TauT family transport system ATP-binding protein